MQPRLRRGRRSWLLLAPLLLLIAGCSSRDPLKQLVAQLDDSTGREEAIHGLVQLVQKAPAPQQQEIRQRVVTALMEAYREDASRPEIVSALVTLRDRRANEVFLAALGDAQRDGTYFEAAIRSAKVIGELALKEDVLQLASALRKTIAAPRPDRNTWLERALIQSLVQLGDARALPVLVEVLKGDPVRQDFYLNKLAASALGELGGTAAIRPLVGSLSSSQHGLLLFEESRRALCRVGPDALPELLAAASRRDRKGQPAENAGAALRVLADIAEAGTVPQLSSLARPKDPLEFRLAVAEAQIRGRAPEGERALLEILRDRDASLTARRHAAELLGWYGGRASAAAVLSASCEGAGPAQNVLCWSGALAYTRLAGPDGLEALSTLAQSRRDEATRGYLKEYRPRLVAIARCQSNLECLRAAFADTGEWRAQERAALELGRFATASPQDDERGELCTALASGFRGVHPQVQEAVLAALERVGPIAGVAAAVASKLKTGDEAAPAALVSRTLCVAQSWRRRSGERR